jgi:hypothetical protein
MLILRSNHVPSPGRTLSPSILRNVRTSSSGFPELKSREPLQLDPDFPRMELDLADFENVSKQLLVNH